MNALSPAEAHALTLELRQTQSLLRLQVPQVWGWDELRRHWPALTQSRIRSLLRQHGVVLGHGKRLAVHVDLVRKIDATLAANPGRVAG